MSSRLSALNGHLSHNGVGRETIPQSYYYMYIHRISGISDLMAERQTATFNIRELTFFLDGGTEVTEQREKIMLEFERDPTFQLIDIHDLTRPQLRERYMTRVQFLCFN